MEVARDCLYSMKQEGDSEQKQSGAVMGCTWLLFSGKNNGKLYKVATSRL